MVPIPQQSIYYSGALFHSEWEYAFMQVFIFLLSAQNLKAGILLLGCVKEVRDFEVTVSLPFNMQSHLSHAGISDPISEIVAREIEMESEDEGDRTQNEKKSLPEMKQLFYIGQYLVCRVVEVKGKNVHVSVNPRGINEGIAAPLIFKGLVSVKVCCASVVCVETDTNMYLVKYSLSKVHCTIKLGWQVLAYLG